MPRKKKSTEQEQHDILDLLKDENGIVRKLHDQGVFSSDEIEKLKHGTVELLECEAITELLISKEIT